MNDARIVKVVRDKIGSFLGGRHNRVEYSDEITHEQHVEELRKKLVEEAVEYLLDPSKAELADVVEVCHALSVVDLHCNWSDIESVRLLKKAERGGFEHGVAMFACTDEEAERLAA